MKEALKIFGALSDESRLRMLFALRHGELCVCQLIDLMGLSASTVSKHLSILREAGLVDSRKQGRWVYCRMADAPPLRTTGKQAAPLFQALERSPKVQADDRALKRICGEKMETLCQRLFRAPRGK